MTIRSGEPCSSQPAFPRPWCAAGTASAASWWWQWSRCRRSAPRCRRSRRTRCRRRGPPRLGCNSIKILGISPSPYLIIFGVLRHILTSCSLVLLWSLNLLVNPNIHPKCLLNCTPELIRVCRLWGSSGEEEVEKEDAERERIVCVCSLCQKETCVSISFWVRGRVITALAKNAGCLQNGSHLLLLTWTYLVSCLFCKRGKKRESSICDPFCKHPAF